MGRSASRLTCFAAALTLALSSCLPLGAAGLQLEPIGSFRTGVFNKGASEIAAYHPATKRVFVFNCAEPSLDILDIADPANPSLHRLIPLIETRGSVHVWR